jgi:Domain of unknown function (DUF4430)
VNRKICVTVVTLWMGTILTGCGVTNEHRPAVANGPVNQGNSTDVTQIGGSDTPQASDSKADSTKKQSSNGTTGQSGSDAKPSANQSKSAGTSIGTTLGTTGGADSQTKTESSSAAKGSTGNTSTATPTTPGTSKSGVELSVTTNFGSQSMYAKRLPYNDGDAVMDILDENLDVDTAYGGGFVNAINGVKSGYTGKQSAKTKKDWFFWVNGSIAAVGANDYMLRQGDDVWWDYHSWDGSTGIPSVIGQYPHPFTTGYGGVTRSTTIYYGADEQDLAKQLQSALQKQGATAVSVKPYSDTAIGSHSENTVVIGLNADLLNHSAIRSLTSAGVKRGEFIQLSAHSYTALHEDGTAAGNFGSGNGAIMAVGNGSGDSAPVWLITGVDQNGLQAAVSAITTHPSSIYHMISAIVSKTGVRNIPNNA